MSPVLISGLADDLNRGHCDSHLVVDWETDSPEEVVAYVRELGLRPQGVVNQVEALIAWQMALVEAFELPGPGAAAATLLDKAKVREALDAVHGAGVRWTAGLADKFPTVGLPSWPFIIKPAQLSGGSQGVRLVNSNLELNEYLDDTVETHGTNFALIAEEFIEGPEYSIDGPVQCGRFIPAVVVEKGLPDGTLFHERGTMLSPPPSSTIREAVGESATIVTSFCEQIGLTAAWLHVELRIDSSGWPQVIEINPRPGGGVHPELINETIGIHPVSLLVGRAVGDDVSVEIAGPFGSGRNFGMVYIEPEQPGTVRANISTEELLLLPGVIAGYVLSPYIAESDRENFFAAALLEAVDDQPMDSLAQGVLDAVTFIVD